MKKEIKNCRNCSGYKKLYAKSKASFLIQNFGLCKLTSEITDEYNRCDKWQPTDEEPLWFKKKELLLYKLHALLQIIEEELE